MNTINQDTPQDLQRPPTDEETAWHALEVDEVLDILDTGTHGISEEEAKQRLAEYGPNDFATGEKVSKLEILLAQIKNPLVLVLVMAAAISLVAGKQADAIVIAVVIVVNTLIGFFQEYKAEEALEKLKSRAAPEAEVIRDCDVEGSRQCVEMRVDATHIVPGDVLLLDAGDKVPADARLIKAVNLEVDESMLTGESTSVSKGSEPLPEDLPVAERTNLLYGGTMVVEGRGRAVVFATGSETEMGKIATLIQETEKVESPLQQKTRSLGQKLGLLALGVAIITLILGFLRGLEFEDVFLFALASAVSSIPEGLPAVMTITLAVGVNRMARRNAIIRKLHAVDTLGAATVICSDKTGTLTTNEMTVREIVVGDQHFEVTGAGFEPQGKFRSDGDIIDPTAHEGLRIALQAGALCNDAHLIEHYSHNDSDYRWEIRGDPTEGALVVAAAKAGKQKETLEDRFERIDEIPFSSKTKWMATFHRTPEGKIWAFVKGAPETILDMSSQYREGGAIRDMGREPRDRFEQANHEMADEALRVLGLAYRIFDEDEVKSFKEKLQNGGDGLIFVGLVGMIDPPRPEVPMAVRRCRNAGIRVIMATGDHQRTAEAIARDIGILGEHEESLVGSDVAQMDDDALDEAVKQTAVFARVDPAHKHRIVEALRRNGEVVAMTGDGVNDAPALQAADIGVAMGISGTDVTKETAEMVLTDDNFASIVNAIEEGRVVFQNVRKVVKFLLATNIGEDITLLSALAFMPGAGLIITPVQILWVNLVTDGILDITLALEPQESDVMEDPPRRTDAGIINREILQNIAYVALFMAVGTLWIFNRGAQEAQTMAFTTLAMFQVFNALNCRSRTKSVFQLGFFANRYLMGAIALSITLQVAAIRLPFMQTALGTVPLTRSEWGLIALVASSVFIAEEIRKMIQRATG